MMMTTKKRKQKGNTMKLTHEEFIKDPKISIILKTCRKFRNRYVAYRKGTWQNRIEYQLDLDRLYDFYLKDEGDDLLFPENVIWGFATPSTEFEENFITYCNTVIDTCSDNDESGVLLFSQIFDIERRDLEDPENFVEDERRSPLITV